MLNYILRRTRAQKMQSGMADSGLLKDRLLLPALETLELIPKGWVTQERGRNMRTKQGHLSSGAIQ